MFGGGLESQRSASMRTMSAHALILPALRCSTRVRTRANERSVAAAVCAGPGEVRSSARTYEILARLCFTLGLGDKRQGRGRCTRRGGLLSDCRRGLLWSAGRGPLGRRGRGGARRRRSGPRARGRVRLGVADVAGAPADRLGPTFCVEDVLGLVVPPPPSPGDSDGPPVSADAVTAVDGSRPPGTRGPGLRTPRPRPPRRR